MMRGASLPASGGWISPSSSRRATSTRLARKWTANISSKPCFDWLAWRGISPAFKTAMSMRGVAARSSSPSRWTLARSARSTLSI